MNAEERLSVSVGGDVMAGEVEKVVDPVVGGEEASGVHE